MLVKVMKRDECTLQLMSLDMAMMQDERICSLERLSRYGDDVGRRHIAA
jgi:hypothetical protein